MQISKQEAEAIKKARKEKDKNVGLDTGNTPKTTERLASGTKDGIKGRGTDIEDKEPKQTQELELKGEPMPEDKPKTAITPQNETEEYVCEDCGAEVSKNQLKCEFCGAELLWEK